MTTTITVYGDYQCPYCAKLDAALAPLLSKYEGKVKLVWKQFPLNIHNRALPAAKAAEVVKTIGGEKSFWKFHKLLLGNQSILTDANFAKWAKASGVDPVEFQAKYASDAYDRIVQKDIASGEALGVSSTPTTFVGDVKILGGDIEAIHKAINDQVSKASAAATATVRETSPIEARPTKTDEPLPDLPASSGAMLDKDDATVDESVDASPGQQESSGASAVLIGSAVVLGGLTLWMLTRGKK